MFEILTLLWFLLLFLCLWLT